MENLPILAHRKRRGGFNTLSKERTLYRAAMAVDADRVFESPGAVLVESNQIVAVGSPEGIGECEDARVVDMPDAVLIPALVNTHCHLDLSHLGPMPFDRDFVGWAEMIRQNRSQTNADIAASVRRGVELSRVGGTAIVGDIAGAGSTVSLNELRSSVLAGVSYLEVFGNGVRQAKAVQTLAKAVAEIPAVESDVSLGLQPHAPYSCGPDVYRAAAAMGRPVATHLAETLEELRFVGDGDGPLAEMLKRIGVWDESIVGQHLHPIDALADSLSAVPVVAAHLNYVQPIHLEMLRGWMTTVAYCPRSSAYFGHPHGGRSPHQYREMIAEGVNVALGTDSLLCLDTAKRISVLDEMRLLYKRDGTDPRLLLRLATMNGAAALGFDPELVTLRPGVTAGVLSLSIDAQNDADPLKQAMSRDDAPHWVLDPAMGESL